MHFYKPADTKKLQDATRCICRQMQLADIVIEEPLHGGRYRYDTHSSNSELQDKIEVGLIDFVNNPRRCDIPDFPDDLSQQRR